MSIQILAICQAISFFMIITDGQASERRSATFEALKAEVARLEEEVQNDESEEDGRLARFDGFEGPGSGGLSGYNGSSGGGPHSGGASNATENGPKNRQK